MNYIIPEEYRVESREAYMADFFDFVEAHCGFVDGREDGRCGIPPADSGVHTARYHGTYAVGYANGHMDFVVNGDDRIVR